MKRRIGPKAPPGAITINEKWLGTPLGNDFSKSSSSIYFEDGLGPIDFFLTESSPVVFIPHSELINSHVYQMKLLCLVGSYSPSDILVVAERNTSTIELYNSLVEFIVVELESYMTVLPVGNQSELPSLLLEMAHAKIEPPESNPFLRKMKPFLSVTQSQMINLIPGIGEKKSRLLLEKIGSIEGIANASEQRLTPFVGGSIAKNVVTFFNEKIRCNKAD